MKVNVIAFWTWTVLAIAGFVAGGIASTKDGVYTGTKIEFNTGRDLQIDAESVTVEAAASDFFVLRKENGETIVGVPTAKPLGWTSSKYFVYGPQEVSGGKWLFSNGTATIKITSEKAITVKTVEQVPFALWLMCFLGVFVIWIIGLLFGSL